MVSGQAIILMMSIDLLYLLSMYVLRHNYTSVSSAINFRRLCTGFAQYDAGSYIQPMVFRSESEKVENMSTNDPPLQ